MWAATHRSPKAPSGGGRWQGTTRGLGTPQTHVPLLLRRGCGAGGYWEHPRVFPHRHTGGKLPAAHPVLAHAGSFSPTPQEQGWLQRPPCVIHSSRAKRARCRPRGAGWVPPWARTEALPVSAAPGWSWVVGKSELERRERPWRKAFRGVRGWDESAGSLGKVKGRHRGVFFYSQEQKFSAQRPRYLLVMAMTRSGQHKK